jgi:hypothetical protein
MKIRVLKTIKGSKSLITPGIYSDDKEQFEPCILQEIASDRTSIIEVLQEARKPKNVEVTTIDHGVDDVVTGTGKETLKKKKPARRKKPAVA